MGKNKIRVRIIILLCIACMLGVSAAGCSLAPAAGNAAASGTDEGQAPAADAQGGSSSEAQPDLSQNPQDNSVGRWQVFDPDMAAAVDADFKGKVWKIEEDTFYIVEVKTAILEDGSLVSSSPSSNAEIPDSDLIPVVYDENTHFYFRSIYDGGDRHEDTDAGTQDLEEHMLIELKGSFKDDIFYADEVRMVKSL